MERGCGQRRRLIDQRRAEPSGIARLQAWGKAVVKRRATDRQRGRAAGVGCRRAQILQADRGQATDDAEGQDHAQMDRLMAGHVPSQ